MCDDMKGKYFFLLKVFNILPRYNTICYTYSVAIYFIFVLGDGEKIVTAAVTRHKEEAIDEEVPSCGRLSRCKAGFSEPCRGRNVTRGGLLPCLICRESHAACLLNVL